MKYIYIILYLITFQTLIYANDLVIEMSAIIDKSNNIDFTIDSVIRNYKYKNKNVSVVSFKTMDPNKENMIKSRFLVSNFYYDKHASKKILSSKKKTDFYIESHEMIAILENAEIEYTQVLNNPEMAKSIGDKNLLQVKNKNGVILISNNIKEVIGVKINKDDVIVIDGDTINYHNVRYRFLGIDAPEMEQTPHGSIASNFVYQKIKNANDVYINVSNRDIYNRVLAHIFVDNESLSLMILTNRLAIQNVTYYSDNGFEEISKSIVSYSKNNRKRLDFLSPRTFRQRKKKEQ